MQLLDPDFVNSYLACIAIKYAYTREFGAAKEFLVPRTFGYLC
jgi:hypothetical protein